MAIAALYLGVMSTLEATAGIRLHPVRFTAGLLVNVVGLAALATALIG